MQDKHILVPIITPFNDALGVCKESVKNIINQLHDYAYGVIPCLTSGEGWCLDIYQWTDMVRYCVKYSQNLKVIAGIEKATTDEVLHFVNLAQSLGVQGVMVTTPFGDDVSQNDMLAHFRKIHDQSDCEVWVYHERPLSKNLLTLDSLLTVSSLPRVVGIKDSGEDYTIIDNIQRFEDLSVQVYHGWEDRLVVGENVKGNIVSLSNLEPAICHKATHHTSDESLQSKINTFCEKYSLTAEDWYRHVKHELWKRGVIRTENIVANAG